MQQFIIIISESESYFVVNGTATACCANLNDAEEENCDLEK